MLEPIRYLRWARRFYGKVRLDLATSGIPATQLADPSNHLEGGSPDLSAYDRLRNAVASYNAVRPEEAVATLGTSHALWLACAAIATEHDDVLVEEPAYEPLAAVAAGTGARIVRFSRVPSERFALDPERIERALTPRTRMVLLSNLHNPGGVRASVDSLLLAARIAERVGAFLVVDEVYAAFDGFVDARGVFRRSARHIAPNVVSISSLTKCYGLGHERVGWLLGPPELVDRVEDILIASAGALPLAHARRGVLAFEKIDALARRAQEVVRGASRKRSLVADWARQRECLWSAPDEGLFGFVTMPKLGDLTALLEEAARAGQVLVAPGSFFGVPNGFRIACSAPEASLAEGLARLGEVLAENRNPVTMS